jgi:hypothetical protein
MPDYPPYGDCLPSGPHSRWKARSFPGNITIIIVATMGFSILALLAGSASLATLAGTAACGLAVEVARRLIAGTDTPEISGGGAR